ncbi:hypothetical protein, partial [Streptomyces acidicola]|uniref:hypothetical protein n=1 Tax=Streptomyces acidicola TaxID=2596892 RepID=UPI001D154E36
MRSLPPVRCPDYAALRASPLTAGPPDDVGALGTGSSDVGSPVGIADVGSSAEGAREEGSGED